MKSISYGFDLQNGKIPVLPNAIEFFGYTLCPANTVVGPWCSFTEYKQSLQTVVKIVRTSFKDPQKNELIINLFSFSISDAKISISNFDYFRISTPVCSLVKLYNLHFDRELWSCI